MNYEQNERLESKIQMQEDQISSAVVELKDVELIYNNQSKPALKDITLSIQPGERVCLLGANGSGKSTLSKVIAGIMAPDSGCVYYHNMQACIDDTGVNSDVYMQARKNIAYVFQDPEDQIVARIVEEDVAFGPENKALPTERIRDLVDSCLKTVAMSEYALADVTEMSGGQQQRIAIASALAMEPKLFIADEPASMLDIRGRRETLRLLNKLQNQGCAIVHVTHFVEEAKHADKIVLLEEGRILFVGNYEQLLENYHLLQRQDLELPFELKLKEALRHHKNGCTPKASPKIYATSDSPVQIEARELSFTYDSIMHAFKGVSFDVHKGEFVCLIGQTGSGKTTLAKTLAGLTPNFDGTLNVFGESLSSRKTRGLIQGKLGYIMQKPERQLFAETVAQDVAYGPRCQGLSDTEVEKRVQEALDALGISHLANRSPFELSGGQQRLAAIAGVLSMHPEILILDEPCASLDSAASSMLIAMLKKLNEQGMTCIMITHSMEDAAYLADTIYVLSKGELVVEGSPADVFAHKALLEKIGLGIPEAMHFVEKFNENNELQLPAVLTFDELVRALKESEVSYELV